MTGKQVNARDAGLQVERTTLAWARTTFAVLTPCGLIMLKNFQNHGEPSGFFAAGLAAIVALVTSLTSTQRQRILRRLPQLRLVAARRQVRITGMSTVALCLATATLVLQA